MFYKKNVNRRRRAPAAESTLSPRFARLLRESWCLSVAAVLVYIALILSTYTKSDRGFSFTGTTDTIANRGGVVGAYLSDLLLYLFGLSAWWFDWRCDGADHGFSPSRRSRSRARASAVACAFGLRAGAVV